MDMYHIIFSKSTVQSREEMKSLPLQDPFSQWSEQTSGGFHHIPFYRHRHTLHHSHDGPICCSKLRHSHSRAILVHSSFTTISTPALAGQALLSKHGHRNFIFHTVQPFLHTVLPVSVSISADIDIQQSYD